jgi:beta-glucosidase
VDYFEKYARICFENFGDRVKNWITFNEPWCSSVLGYGLGEHAPGRVSADEPYLAAHNILLCHARAVTVYRSEFSQNNGSIGITNNCDFRYPLTGSEADKAAAERSLEFFLAWFADPIWKGDYPAVMRERLGERLPQFTTEQKKELLGSSDFFGLNHYSSMLASEPILGEEENDNLAGNGGMIEDQDVKLSVDPAWSQTHMGWNIVPSGCRDLLQWIDERYDRPVIYITENGCACDEPDVETALQDTMRSEFYSSYIQACAEAIEQGVDLRGYFAWSLMDNFEWSHGYGQRFGMCHINYETQERTPKLSAKTFSEIIASGGDVLF